MSAALVLVDMAEPSLVLPRSIPLAKCAAPATRESFAAQCVADAERRRARAVEVARTTLSRPRADRTLP